MISIRQRLVGQAQIFFTLFAISAVFAALRNVTVDDAVLTGVVVPQYLPSASSWNEGNNCSECLAKPDPSHAYNGTWHDTTFSPNSGISPAVEFTFVGSALYIFFILANTVPDAGTLTDLIFYLDDLTVGTFVHVPSTSTDYQYNVPVYINESLVFGEHNMTMGPVNSGNSVLILFDYLVYTTDTNNTITSSPLSPSSSTTPSSTSSESQGTTSRQNTAVFVGGTVGGLVALLLMAASLLCYRRYKRRKSRHLVSSQKGPVLGSFISLDVVTPSLISLQSTSSRVHHMESHLFEPELPARSPVTLRPPSPPISINPPSTSSFTNNNASTQAALIEQLELLRDEVSRLRRLQRHNQKFHYLGNEDTP